MRHLSTLFTALVLAGLLAGPALAEPPTKEEARARAEKAGLTLDQWSRFSENVVVALQSGHDGLRASGLRLIIQYDGALYTDQAVFDIMRLYRDHDDDSMRRMAVVALGKMQHRWAMGALRRDVDFEQTPSVRHTIQHVLATYDLERAAI